MLSKNADTPSERGGCTFVIYEIPFLRVAAAMLSRMQIPFIRGVAAVSEEMQM